METVQKLLLITPKTVVYRSSHARIRIIRDKPHRSGDYRDIYARVSLGNIESTGDSYTLNVRCHGTEKNPTDFKFRPQSNIWVHCSCPYFTYYLEVALQLYGSSQIYNSNGQFPKIRNPSLKPYFCKHLYALSLALLKKDKGKR